jgi:hypothetical protein
MYKIKIIFFIAFFWQINYAQNYIEYSNATQTKTVNSNEEVIVSVTAKGYGSDSFGLVAIAPYYCAWDNGLIGIIYSNGQTHLRPGEVETINFKFRKTVTSNSQFIYEFIRPSPRGNLWDSCSSPKIKITINYIAPSCNLTEPTNFTSNNVTLNSVSLNWSDVASASSYRIYYKNNSSSGYNNYIDSSFGSALVGGLLSGTTYDFKIIPKCSNGLYSSNSKTINVTTLCNSFLAPTNITATPSGYGYIINCAPANYYTLEYVDLVTNQTGTAWVSTGKNFNDGNNFFYYVSPPKSFKFRLKQFSGNCNKFSDWVTVNPQLCPSNNFPTNLILYSQCGSSQKPSFCGAYVRWDLVPNSAGYKFEYIIYNPVTGQNYSYFQDCTSNSFTISSNYLTGTWYVKYRVKTKCSNNTWSDYSPWSANFIWN